MLRLYEDHREGALMMDDVYAIHQNSHQNRPGESYHGCHQKGYESAKGENAECRVSVLYNPNLPNLGLTSVRLFRCPRTHFVPDSSLAW